MNKIWTIYDVTKMWLWRHQNAVINSKSVFEQMLANANPHFKLCVPMNFGLGVK